MKLRLLVAGLLIAALAVLLAQALGDDASGGDRDDPSPEVTEVERAPAEPDDAVTAPEPDPAPTLDPERLGEDLQDAVRTADSSGQLELAAFASDWSEPVVISNGGRGGDSMRMWSMSKVLVLVTLLRELGWDDKPGRAPSAELTDALRGAITRSENCRQRRVVLELQELVGGAEQVASDLEAVMALAGAEVVIPSGVEPPEDTCVGYLSGQTEIADPLAGALLLGTSEWTTEDAARFTNALASGVYGDAVADVALGLMRLPKARSRELPPGELVVETDWGAGAVFGPGDVAYKAGWGGAEQGDFLAGQIVVIPLAGGESLSLAVMDHPGVQPPLDDPGLTIAPEAIAEVLSAARDAVDR